MGGAGGCLIGWESGRWLGRLVLGGVGVGKGLDWSLDLLCRALHPPLRCLLPACCL